MLMNCTSIFSENKHYISNRSPLADVPFYALPIGTVRADGWILKQLNLQKEGLTGNAENLYNSDNDLGPNSDWLGGNGDSWERAPYYTKGVVALAYVLNDQALINKANKWINWSLNNQQDNGFFGPPKNTDWWPRMPMLYAIRDFYEATSDERVIPFMLKYFAYQNNHLISKNLDSWGRSRAGDNIELAYWLYNLTGESFLLDLTDKLKSQAYDWTDIFTNNQFNAFQADFQPKHNVNIPQAMKMPAIYFQKSGEQPDKMAYLHGYNHLMCEHGQPMGMQSGNEMVGGRSAMTGLELCSIVEQMQSSETAQMILGDAYIGDQLEKVAFNALPGALTKDMKGLQYYTQANQVKSKFGNLQFGQQYDNGILPGPLSGYGCCRFNFHMGWPYFVKHMWAATNDNGLAIMAYGPSHLTAQVANGKEVSIIESTNYPFSDTISLHFSIQDDAYFPLKLRIPAWCKQPTITVNGDQISNILPGSFHTITRTWKNEDVVSIQFPMHIELNQEVNNTVSVQRGPLVYALKIAEQWTTRTDFGNGFKEYEVIPASNWNYALICDTNNLQQAFDLHFSSMPENPFVQATTPVTLSVDAKKINSWTYALNNLTACDPPYGPIESTSATERITLVPFGAETLRATCLPLIGSSAVERSSFKEEFNDVHQKGWVNYNGSFMVDNGELLATNTVGYLGSKSVQSSTMFDNFTYDAQIKIGTEGDGGVIFRADKLSMGADEYKGYYAGISVKNKQVILGKANGGWTSLRTFTMDIQADTWYQLRVVAKGSNIKIYVNNMNTPVINFTDISFTQGSIGVRCYGAITRWDNLRVQSLSTEISALQSTENKISVFPNPTDQFLDILCAGVINDFRIDVIDAKGSILDTKFRMNNAEKMRLDTSRLSSGVYLLQFTGEDLAFQSKFIKE